MNDTEKPYSPSPSKGEGEGHDLAKPSEHMTAVVDGEYENYHIDICEPIPHLGRLYGEQEIETSKLPESFERSYKQLSRDAVVMDDFDNYVRDTFMTDDSLIDDDDLSALSGVIREREWMPYWDDVDHSDIDVQMLREEYPWLLGRLVHQPMTELNSAELALRVLRDNYSAEVGFRNIPKRMTQTIESLRADDLGRLVFVDVRVSHRSTVRPWMYLLQQTCDCGEVHNTWQQAFDEVELHNQCRICQKHLVDEPQYISTQDIKLQDLHTRVDSSNPSELGSRLKRGHVRSVESGEIVRLALVVRADDTADEKHPEIASEVVGVQRLDERFDDIEVSDQERDRIEEVAERDDVHDVLAECIAPTLTGGSEYELARKACLYQMAGGVRHGAEPSEAASDGGEDARRGVIHVGLIGDPSTGKSQIARAAERIAPKSEFANADSSGSTAVGLTASVTQEETFSETEWVVSGGVLPRANEGVAIIDELDKASETAKDSLHVPLSNQIVPVNKADISATLNAKASVLMVANPDAQRFSLTKSIVEQFPLPAALFDRVDVLIPFLDSPDENQDREVAKTLRNLEGGANTEFDENYLRKHLSVAKEREPSLTDDAAKVIEERYVELRSDSKRKEGRVSITTRHLQAMRRIAEASAKIRLSEEATAEDAQRGIDIVESSLRMLATNQFGELDADRVSAGPSARQRDVMGEMFEIVEGLSASSGSVDEAIVLEEAENHDISASEALSAIKCSDELWKNQHGVGVVNDE